MLLLMFHLELVGYALQEQMVLFGALLRQLVSNGG